MSKKWVIVAITIPISTSLLTNPLTVEQEKAKTTDIAPYNQYKAASAEALHIIHDITKRRYGDQWPKISKGMPTPQKNHPISSSKA
jgi:hypothetical protein